MLFLVVSHDVGDDDVGWKSSRFEEARRKRSSKR